MLKDTSKHELLPRMTRGKWRRGRSMSNSRHKPSVSIVVPIYNVEQYLEKCFNSLINQTYGQIEVILVNDGSTDGSGALADTLAKKSKKALAIHKKNGGLSDARNAGMKIAKGEYITFIDSDDYVDATFVEVLVKAAQENNADISQCDNSRKPENLGSGSGKAITLTGKDAFIELMKYKTVSPTAWGKLYKTALFVDNNLEFPVGRLHEDTAVLYKLIYSAKNVTCVDRVLYYYRINENSIMTASYTDRHYDSVVKYHEELDEFITENKIAIDKKVIYKHKALRYLSVLNKLALHHREKSDTYVKFKKEYLQYAGKTNDVVCRGGAFLVRMPSLFRGVQSVTPKVRRILGKA